MLHKIDNLRFELHKSMQNYKNNIALKFQHKNISYKELLDKAFNLSEAIRTYGATSKRVGILTQRSEAAFVGVASSIINGFTYVPLNPKLPNERLKQIVQSGEINIILTDKLYFEQTKNLVFSLDKKVHIILYELLKDFKEDCIMQRQEESENKLIYILFTSGSTGLPKGVPINNSNLCGFLNNINKILEVNENDFISQTFDLSFDLSMFDILVSWMNGATLCIMSDFDLINPIEYIIRNEISVWFSVPSLISNIMALGKYKKLDSLRLSLFCGEALHQKQCFFWHQISPSSNIYNLYGPTEITIACTYFKIDTAKPSSNLSNGIISIGNLFEGLDYIILNENYSNIVKEYEIGELCIAGNQVFDGYIASDQAPFISYKNISYYKTGDLVKKNSCGELDYISRNDGQIKISGFRIEIGEIENNIKSIEGVLNAVVVVVEDNNHSFFLSAHVKCNNLSVENIRTLLEKKLPKYMIPKNINLIEEIPLNINGKTDRKALALA